MYYSGACLGNIGLFDSNIEATEITAFAYCFSCFCIIFLSTLEFYCPWTNTGFQVPIIFFKGDIAHVK